MATFPIVPDDITDRYAVLVDSGAGCIGTPDDAIAFIENLLKGSGGFGAIMELAHNWADWEATKRHYELMARFVHPHFQRSRELRRVAYAYAKDHHEEFSGQSSAAVQAEIDRLAARKGGRVVGRESKPRMNADQPGDDLVGPGASTPSEPSRRAATRAKKRDFSAGVPNASPRSASMLKLLVAEVTVLGAWISSGTATRS